MKGYKEREFKLTRPFVNQEMNLVTNWFMEIGQDDNDAILEDIVSTIEDNNSLLNYKGKEVYRVIKNAIYNLDYHDQRIHLELKNFRVLAEDFEVDDYRILLIKGSLEFFTSAFFGEINKKISAKKKKEIEEYISDNLHNDLKKIPIEITDYGEIVFKLNESCFYIEDDALTDAVRFSLNEYHWDYKDYHPLSNSLDFILS